jgi:hypothetical protein
MNMLGVPKYTVNRRFWCQASPPQSLKSTTPLRARQEPPPPQERDAPEGATRAVSPEIQEAGEDSGAALPRDVGGSEAQALELACAPRAAAFEVGDDVEDDEEATVCNTLEHGLECARHTFDELILPATW